MTDVSGSPSTGPGPELAGWTRTYSGKVRDLYRPSARRSGPDVGLVVASDRVSAFDHVLRPGIPGKGERLTRLTLWWLERLPQPNHLADPADAPPVPDEVAARSMVVRMLDMHPVECVVRGHLTGSGLAEYRETGAVCGVRLPPGLGDGDALPEPIYTPAWKAPVGEHDENIDFDRTVELVGAETAEALRRTSLDVFRRAAEVAADRGLLLADTKFEFGTDPESGELVLADEVLTSDSSRYWDAEARRTGRTPAERMASFDKQIVRDWLKAHWDGSGEPPELPEDVIRRTADRYDELLARLTGS